MDQDPQREDPHRPPVVFVFGPGASTMVASFQHLNSQVPGLLIMDTPSMYALRYLRCKGRFGASLCDIAILLVDIMDGLTPLTIESLKVLTEMNTPFVVALNRIDR